MNETLNNAQVMAFFTGHLDRIYYAKTHMIHSFPAMANHADFPNIKLAIEETTDDKIHPTT